jgi:hypothetical protein
MRHDLHHAAVNRRRWTKNIATTVASMLTTFTKQRDEQTKSQHVALVKSRSKLSTDVASLMKSITVSHRAMAQSLSDSLHAYMKVARSHGAALHGSFMAPAMLKPAMAAGGHMHVEAASTHSPLIIHDQGHDSGDRQRGKRKT